MSQAPSSKLDRTRRVASVGLVFFLATSACGLHGAEPPLEKPLIVAPRDESTRVEVQTNSPIGRIALWVPEAVMSDRGACAIYPQGAPWRQVDGAWEQAISVRESYGPGNYRRVSEDLIDFVDIDVPIDSPVSWTTRLKSEPGRLTFEIRLRNAGKEAIRRAAAAVCVKFLDADWWSDETTLAAVEGGSTSLAKLGRGEGADPRFEAYRLRDQSFNNPFYVAFWGFNRQRISQPMLVSEHREAGLCAVVSCERAYFMHCNFDNPCTDAMLAFGDVPPGEESTARGAIEIAPGRAADLLVRYKKTR